MPASYPTYPQPNYAAIAKQILAQWTQRKTFQKSIAQRQGKPSFTFFEGPPGANGAPGIHHILSRTLKDTFCRYKTQKGFKVSRKAGWDTHGLPVELQVEKELQINKSHIGHTISIAAYNQRCRDTVMKYKNQWDAVTRALGYWVDLDNPYITYENSYIESAWHVLKKLYEKKLLYKGYAIQPYSPAAGTGLSNHELNQPGCYKPVQDHSLVAQFQSTLQPNHYYLAWTTTPWTLPANSALAVNPAFTYVTLRTFNPYTHLPIHVTLAQKALHRYFDLTDQVDKAASFPSEKPKHGNPWQLTQERTGHALIGQTYKQLMPYVQPKKSAFRIIPADFITTTEGTGIVHIAPSFGADDLRVAQKNNIPAITVLNSKGEAVPIVDRQGRFVNAITDFAGAYVKAAYDPEAHNQNYQSVDLRIALQLKKANKVFQIAKYTHNYPHCWRTDKPILYYPLQAWFIKTTAYRDRLLELNHTINWKPKATGTGRFGNWLANIVDWNLSRDRFWGIPLPIWRTRDQQQEKCVGSLEELHQEVNKAIKAGFMHPPLPPDMDLHRPYVDDIVLVSEDGQKMYRETAVVDVWFDSGVMPYAQWHYPFENKTVFQNNFPADFIAEGIDQTRGWFFTLHAISTLLFDQVAFKNVIAHGLLLDKHGNKMSKRLGNAIDPFVILDIHGPDVLRWYMISNANPWENLKFDTDELPKVKNRFFNTLYNTYQLFARYANLAQYKPIALPPKAKLTSIDQWILSKLHHLIQNVTTYYDTYEPTRAARAIEHFAIDSLSNWYVRRNRKRFWKGATQDKHQALAILHNCLTTITQLAAPIAPFYMDKVYQDLHQGKGVNTSVHLTDFPTADVTFCNKNLEVIMEAARTICSLAHALRKKHQLKVRQPLASLTIYATEPQAQQAALQRIEELIRQEVNVKQIVYLQDAAHMGKRIVKPNFKRLGNVYRTLLPKIQKALANFSVADVIAFEQKGHCTLVLDGQNITLTLADVTFATQPMQGQISATQANITVMLDTAISKDLWQEGIAREMVSQVQQLRRMKGLAVKDSISVVVADPALAAIVVQYQAYLCQEVQATQWQCSHTPLQGEIDVMTLQGKPVPIQIKVL